MRAPQSRRSDREALAALGAATSQHLASSSRGHAGAKAVRALTFNFAGLVSTLHAGISTMSKNGGSGQNSR